MVRAAAEVGLKTKLFGGAMVGMQYASLMGQLGDKLNRLVNYHMYVPSEKLNYPGIEAFLKKYQARAKDAGVDPLGFYQPPFAYAAMQVLEQAITATKSLDEDTLVKYMRSHTFKTIEGDIAFGPEGEWTEARPIWTQYHDIKGHDVDQFRFAA